MSLTQDGRPNHPSGPDLHASVRPAPRKCPSSTRGATLVLAAIGCLLGIGVVLAALGLTDASGTTTAAETPFGAPPVESMSPEAPPVVAPTPVGEPAVAPKPAVDPKAALEQARARAAREREADELIQRLVEKMRRERAERVRVQKSERRRAKGDVPR